MLEQPVKMKLCQKCGDCCRSLKFINFMQFNRDDKEFYRARGLEVGNTWVKIKDFVCPHLTTENLCDIYSKRPMYCRISTCPKKR